jgi:hypothetical protein
MTDPTPTRDSLREDFSYIRGALERQRRFVRYYIPVWFAAVTGMIVIGAGVLKDLQVAGLISQATKDTSQAVLWGLAIALVAANGFFSKKSPQGSSLRCGKAGRDFAQIIIPWIIYAGGIVLIKYLGVRLGVDHDALRAFFLAYSAAAFMLIGFGRLNIIFGFGVGLALGALVMYFIAPPFPFTWIGVLVETGLVAGAFLDHHAYRIAAGTDRA